MNAKRAKEKGIYNALANRRDFRKRLVLEALCVGIFAGAIVSIYRYVIQKSDLWRSQVYRIIEAKGFAAVFTWFIFLLASAHILGLLVREEPSISGSGIPQVKGILAGRMRMRWLSVIIYKFVGGVIALGSGLSLGREGPSVQLGAAAGQGVSRILERLKVEEKYLITCGASAGLSAAFSAPLAGAIFALEELHKNFSPTVLLPAMMASMTAGFISQQFFGQTPIFNFGKLDPLPLKYYFCVLILGMIMGALGVFFNFFLVKMQSGYKRLKLKPELKLVIPIVLGGILGFFLPQVLGGGNALINSLDRANYSARFLIILLAVKFLFTMISYGSGAPGGIFASSGHRCTDR